MACLNDLALYLQAQGLGTLAQTIFQGGFPMDTPAITIQDAVLALIPAPGLPPTHVHNQPGPILENPMVQVLIRGAQYGYQAAESRAQTAFLELDSVRNQTLSGTFYLMIQAMQSPFYLKMDDLARPILAFNVRCEKYV